MKWANRQQEWRNKERVHTYTNSKERNNDIDLNKTKSSREVPLVVSDPEIDQASNPTEPMEDSIESIDEPEVPDSKWPVHDSSGKKDFIKVQYDILAGE